MGEVPSLPFDRIVQVFQKFGYTVVRRGKHIIMKRLHGPTIIIPRHKPVNVEVLRAILKLAKIEPQEFKKHL